MAASTGISWTDGTANFVIGCCPAGPGCDHCYAAVWADQKWGIKFVPGGERRVTKSAFQDPPRWHRKHLAGTAAESGTPTWVFACSLSDFFDNEWPDGLRDRAWAVIRECHTLRWQIVTKRIGNLAKMLPADWDGGANYPHVGVIATMVNQVEINRDMPKLRAAKAALGVKWIGLSIEPQLSLVNLWGHTDCLDWVITGGESKQGKFEARPYDLAWPRLLVEQCQAADVPVFVKQMGDAPISGGKPVPFRGKGTDPQFFPTDLRVQEMPRIYGSAAATLVSPKLDKADLFGGAA